MLLKKGEVEVVAKAMCKAYCPGSWPLAWKRSSEETKEGWRRSAKIIMLALDQHRGRAGDLAKANERIRKLEMCLEASDEAIITGKYDKAHGKRVTGRALEVWSWLKRIDALEGLLEKYAPRALCIPCLVIHGRAACPMRFT
ncbi:hypothetical protein [Methylobacter sp.]|uniref:hypothetical protein n=1 Tax=Methylobacter sp. TaxID=2051955 RepID=UPI00121A8A48|nr:hypothetical protein [Methylobacter sp.]TAK59519.1 MAG: hypothetical protein EPO18_20370 [Methylobacter sp.]